MNHGPSDAGERGGNVLLDGVGDEGFGFFSGAADAFLAFLAFFLSGLLSGAF